MPYHSRLHFRTPDPTLPRYGADFIRFLGVIVLILLAGPQLHAQSGRCSLTLANLPPAPELLGFKLGMTKEQVKVRVPHVSFGKSDDLGVSKTTINPHFDPRFDQSNFEGVRTISLDFLDDVLTSLWIGYEGSFNEDGVDEFVKRISQSLSLPDAWKPWRSRGQQMNCANFQLIVTMVAGGPSFRIIDTSSEDLLSARREAKAEAEQASAETTVKPESVVADKSNRTYYPAGCQAASKVPDSDRLIFKSAEEADKAGFKVAKCE